MQTITVNDLKVACIDEQPLRDRNNGEVVILAHCANGSHKEWQSLLPLLLDRGYRVLAADFCGYGRSEPWPDNRPFDPAVDVNIILALVERARDTAGGKGAHPVRLHFVGHSHGGAIVMEAARHIEGVRSITVVEPTLFQLLHETGHRQWPVITRMARRVTDALEAGNARRAARLFTSFWIGRVKWLLLPERHKRAISRSMKKVVLDFEIIDLVHRTPEHYGEIGVPVQLIVGTWTKGPTRAVSELLLAALPNAKWSSVRAGHMSPVTHPDRVNRLVLEHLDNTRAQKY